MAFVIADRVRETSTTAGTGNFTLAGAVDRFRTFDSVLDTGDTTYYTISDQSGVGWEVGIATFTSPSTLARTTILSSSNGGSAVDFGAGSKDVFITLPASRTVTSVDGGSTGLTPSTASYGAISLGGTLVAANGGTGQSSYTIGDLLYASGTTALSKLADVAIGSALISGGVATAPSWGKIGLTTHVSGTLPVANGGTGTTTAFTAGSVVFAGASGVYSQDNSNLFWDDSNNRLGVGTATPVSSIETNGTITAPTLAATNLKHASSASNNIVLDNSGNTAVGGTLSFNSGYGSAATAYGCRAWVNFNGTGAVAIRASGNVTSITDNGTGDYTVNIATALTDANYSAVGSCGSGAAGNDDYNLTTNYNAAPTTSAVRIGSQRANSGVATDAAYISLSIFR